MYYCPSRRTSSTAGREDYAFAFGNTLTFGDPVTYDTIIWGMSGGGPFKTSGDLTLGQLTSADGSSNTLMLAGKGMRPSDYGDPTIIDGGGQGDLLTWAWASTPYIDPANPASGETWIYQHIRYPYGMVQDTNKPHPVGTGIDWIGVQDRGGSDPFRHSSMSRSMGSPHPGAMPCLYGDGAVRSVSYTINNALCQWAWFYNDGKTNTDPALQ